MERSELDHPAESPSSRQDGSEQKRQLFERRAEQRRDLAHRDLVFERAAVERQPVVDHHVLHRIVADVVAAHRFEVEAFVEVEPVKFHGSPLLGLNREAEVRPMLIVSNSSS